MTFLDANIVIRILIQDNQNLSEKAKNLFKKSIQNKQKIILEDSVVAEILWVCTSKHLYNQDRLEVAQRLIALVSSDNIYHPYKSSLIYAIYKYSQINLDFVDCLAISYRETGIVSEVLTFDKEIIDQLKTSN